MAHMFFVRKLVSSRWKLEEGQGTQGRLANDAVPPTYISNYGCGAAAFCPAPTGVALGTCAGLVIVGEDIGTFDRGASCSTRAAAAKTPPMPSAVTHSDIARYFGIDTLTERSKR